MYPIDFFWRAAARFPDSPAVIHPAGTISFRDLAARVLGQAASLTSMSSVVGQPVCVGAANTIDHLIAILSVLAAGKVWVPLNPRNGDPELKRIVEFVEPCLVLADTVMQDRLSGTSFDIRHFSELGNNSSDTSRVFMGPASTGTVSLAETQAIKFTGGTTGAPKGVKQPLRAWNTNIVSQIHELKLTSADRYLVAAPLTHGTSTYMLPVLGSGGALIFPDASTPAGLLGAAEKYDASIFFAPPTLILSLGEEQRRHPRILKSLRLLVYGGAPMRADYIRQAQDVFGPVICTSYGQTEAPQIITYLPPAEMVGDNVYSVGRPSLLTRVAILHKDGSSTPPGEDGEIAVRGDLVMTGYFNAEEETSRVMVDGWLRTGDVGCLDDRGYLFIKDRLRDVIITGGFNVYPGDVESVLAGHPAIMDCSVVGVPDDKWGEAVHAAVQIRPGHPFAAPDLISYVKKELGSVKAPKEVHLFETLPRSAVGKVLKPAIRSEILRRQEYAR